MRILQLISSGGFYGAEAVAVSLSAHLARLGNRAVLGVFHNVHNPHLEIVERAASRGVAVEIIPCQGKLDWRAVRAVRRCVADHDIDVVHTHGYKSDFYAYLALHSSKPLVATCHTWNSDTLSLRVYSGLDRVLLRRFDRIVAVSQPIADILLQSGVRREKVKVIANGIEVERYESAPPSLRRELRGNGTVVVGLVGRLAAQKGPEFFLRAAKEVVARYPQTLFVLVGSGPLREHLEAQARELEIAEHTVFAGQRNDMPEVYASLDIFVLPSLYEGLPIALLEAMASRKPVIATPVGAVPQVIQHERTGLLVQPQNPSALCEAMCRLIADCSFRQQLADNGYRLVREHFSMESMTQDHLRLYQEALAAKRG